jgi:7-cyano-7-deazaguanine synthase
MHAPKAVILVSGGLDSATMLCIAKQRGYDCYVLTVNYGQRSQAEVNAARHICEQVGVHEHRVIDINLADFGGSALTDRTIAMPQEHNPTGGIPVTYVPARNTIFLSLALSYAETLEARDIFIGAHVIDYSNYPDCRQEFFNAFERLATLGTKAGVELGKQACHIHAPLLQLDKSEIIRLGASFGLDYAQTLSCYDATEHGLACGTCPSCIIRKEGFKRANLPDPTRYI